jgi:hypothetical protein
MKKTTVYFDDVTQRRLIELSRRRRRSQAALIRDAVEDMIANDDRPPRVPRPLGASGHSDTSQRVDEILDEGSRHRRCRLPRTHDHRQPVDDERGPKKSAAAPPGRLATGGAGCVCAERP